MLRRAPLLCAGLLALAGCSSYQPGLEVAFELRSAPAGTSDAGAARVDLSRGFLTLTSLELRPCEPTHATLWRQLRPVGTAHAHTPTTPTRLGVPTVLDLTSAAPASPGVLRPPPARYCALRWEAGPADADATGLASAPGHAGLTLRLEGVVDEGSATPRAFVATSTARASGTIALPAWSPERADGPLRVVVLHHLDALLAGVDGEATPEAVARRALENLGSSLSVELP